MVISGMSKLPPHSPHQPVVPPRTGRSGAYEAQHRRGRNLELVAPDDVAVLDLDDLAMGAHSGASQPPRHRARRAAESSVADWVHGNLADVNDEHLAGLGAFDVDTATGWVASGELAYKLLAVGVVVEPWAPVDLRLDFELLARLDMEGRGVVGSGLEVEYVGGRAFHWGGLLDVVRELAVLTFCEVLNMTPAA